MQYVKFLQVKRVKEREYVPVGEDKGWGLESRKATAKKERCELDFVGLMKIFNCLCQKDIPSIR